jgi:hypothetical protein
MNRGEPRAARPSEKGHEGRGHRREPDKGDIEPCLCIILLLRNCVTVQYCTVHPLTAQVIQMPCFADGFESRLKNEVSSAVSGKKPPSLLFFPLYTAPRFFCLPVFSPSSPLQCALLQPFSFPCPSLCLPLLLTVSTTPVIMQISHSAPVSTRVYE